MSDGASGIAGGDLNRKYISLGWSIQITDLDEPDLRCAGVCRYGHLLDHAHLAKGSRLRSEPAASLNVGGEDFAFEACPSGSYQQRFKPGWYCNCGNAPLLRGARSRGLWANGKPVEGMRPKHDGVARFSNPGKIVLAENFREPAAGEAGKIKLSGLRKARKIDHHQDGLMVVAPQEGEHLGIVRIEKFERAARQRLEIFAHGNYAAHPPQKRG